MNQETELEDFAPLAVILITAIGGWLRFFLLGSKGMWLDETFSMWLASHSVADMLHWGVQIDPHPPLYYLLLHYWMEVNGDTPYYVRLLSALFGMGTIPMMYLIGKRISGAVVGVTAAVCLAFSPYHIYFAQEARMYSLLTFNAAVAIYALVRLLSDPRSVKPIGGQFREYPQVWRTYNPVASDAKQEFSYGNEILSQGGWRAWIFRHRWLHIQTIETDLTWLAFIVFSALTLLTHNTAVFFPAATNLFVLGLMLFQRFAPHKPGAQPAFQAPPLGNWVKAQIGIFLLWSPWLVPFIRQTSRVDQEFWLPKPTWEAVTETLRVLLNPSAQTQLSQVMTWVLCVVLFFGLVYYRKQPSTILFLAALFAIPFLGELVVSIRRPIFYGRTLIWITIPLFLLLGAGIAQIRFNFLMTVAVGILGANYLFSAGDYYRFVQKEEWSTPAGYVANFAEKDDLVLFNSNFVVIPFNYYFKQYEDLYSMRVEKRGVPLDLFESGILEPRMTEDDIPGLIALVSGRERVWLVYSHDSYTDPAGLIPKTLASKMKLVRTRDFYGGQVQLYEAP